MSTHTTTVCVALAVIADRRRATSRSHSHLTITARAGTWGLEETAQNSTPLLLLEGTGTWRSHWSAAATGVT
jgi:hypothetical protein